MVKEIRFCKFTRLVVWTKGNSVPERAFYGTEYACRAQKGFLRYATRFLEPSVLKTGFWGTEVIFGTGNPLLWYGVHLQCASCLASPHVDLIRLPNSDKDLL